MIKKEKLTETGEIAEGLKKIIGIYEAWIYLIEDSLDDPVELKERCKKMVSLLEPVTRSMRVKLEIIQNKEEAR